jgi:hypothetical protein
MKAYSTQIKPLQGIIYLFPILAMSTNVLTENKNRITYRFCREARSPISGGIFPERPLLTMYLHNIED